MEATQDLGTALEQLRWVESRVDSSQSLETLRSLYDRVQSIRLNFPGDFDLQMSAADLQERLVERGRHIRAGMATVNTGAVAAPGRSEEAEEVLGPAPPPDVVEMDATNWKRTIYVGAFFALLLFAAFFYLIQMARQLNHLGETASQASAQASGPANKAQPAGPVAPPPVRPTLRLYTDLVPGKVSVDGGSEEDLQDGELTLENLKAGQHNVRLRGPSGNAAFDFEVQEKKAPQLVGTPSADNAMIVTVSAQGGEGQLATNATPAQVLLDGKVAGDVTGEGLKLTALGTNDHDLEIKHANDEQRFILTYTTAPVLTVFVKSDPNAGSLLVLTGEDGAEVSLNGKPYRRLTQHGQLRIPSLRVGTYRINVRKAGFLDAPPSIVQVTKGGEARAEFHLSPVPQVGTLEVSGAQPGTTVYLDHDLLATIGPEGSAVVPSIASGEHGIELRREGSVTKHFARTFVTGEKVTLSGTDVLLEKIPLPETRPITPPTVEAAKKPVAAEPKEDTSAAVGERIQNGGGYVVFHVTKVPGKYTFWVRQRKGGHLLHRDRLQWFAGYQDQRNVVLFELDGKHLVMRDTVEGKATEKRRIPFDADTHEWVQVEMTVRADSVSVRVRRAGDAWLDGGSLPSEGRDFTQGKVGFLLVGSDEIGIRNFQFVK